MFFASPNTRGDYQIRYCALFRREGLKILKIVLRIGPSLIEKENCMFSHHNTMKLTTRYSWKVAVSEEIKHKNKS